jgi:uncharacterized repeat protein (TIGR02543 family)
MNSKKIGLFAAILIFFLTSMSWGTKDNPTGGPTGNAYDWRINRIMLKMGKDNSSTRNFYDISNSWYGVYNTSDSWSDLEAYGETGSEGYVYMAFEKTTQLCGLREANGQSVELPITDIIIENYPTNAPETIYINGRMYKKLHIANNYDSPLNKDHDRSNYGLWMYYTQDFIDGYAITDIKVTVGSKTELQPIINGYSIVTNGSRDPQNLIAASFSTNKKYNYLHVKKDLMEVSAAPTLRQSLSFKYGPSSLYNFNSSTLGTSTSNATHYKFDNKYEDGLWKENNGDDTFEPGTYYVYLKNRPYPSAYFLGSNYAPNVKGPFTMTISKLTTADFTATGLEQIKIYTYNSVGSSLREYDSYYSGEKLNVLWKDYCVAPGTFNSNKKTPPSDAKFYYSTTGTGSWTQFDVASKWFDVGTYYIKAYKPGNKYCEDINISPVKITVKKSKIVVVKNNGLADDVIEQNYNTSITYKLPTGLTKTGYTFDGWDASLPSKMPVGVTTINAKWKVNSYTLALYPNNPNSSNIYTKTVCSNYENESCYSDVWAGSSTTYNYNARISYPTLYKIGYTHTGWSPSQPTFMPANNLTLSARWKINQYTLTFDTDGGSEIAPITQNYGTAVTKPSNPTKAGFDFTGWDSQIPTTMPAANKTFKALWDTASYTITFKDGYTNTPIQTINTKYNRDLSSIAYPSNPTRTGYTFAGWDTPTLPSKMPMNNIVVTAMWNINKYQVTFPEQMEAVTPSNFTGGNLDYGTTLKLKFKDGYKCLGNVYKNGTKISASNGVYTISSVTGNTNITADKIYEDYGSILIMLDHSEAIIGYEATETKEIADPIKVDSITYAHTFTKNMTETIMLPFEMDLRYMHGGIFCKFTGYNKADNIIRMIFMRTKLEANTPYLIVPTSKNLTFHLPNDQKVAIQTSENHSVREGDWEFRGTYDFTDWANLKNEVGCAYIFIPSGTGDGVSGQFRKVTADDVLDPLHGYLIHNPINKVNRPTSAAFAAPSTANTFSLPDVINIKIESEDGKTTALGSFNTRTGEMKIDRWFDAQGRLLKGKPTIEGIYYNNGKKVIVK